MSGDYTTDLFESIGPSCWINTALVFDRLTLSSALVSTYEEFGSIVK